MAKAKDYQALSAELEAVLAQLQTPDIKVDEAVDLYESGLKLIAELEQQLKQAENKLEKLSLQQETGE